MLLDHNNIALVKIEADDFLHSWFQINNSGFEWKVGVSGAVAVGIL